MKKVGMSISLSIETVVRIEEYTKEHGRSFSRFMERAANYYLDHNQTVANVSIQDSEPIVQPIDDTPKPKNDFNFNDM